MAGNKTVIIEGEEIHLSKPDPIKHKWIGQSELIGDLESAWEKEDEDDLPMNPVLVGDPGNGKTTLALEVSKRLNMPSYTITCTSDIRPDDLIIKYGPKQGGGTLYTASNLVTAMIVGGVCILDEANRMNEKSWASIASLMDDRRYVDSNYPPLRIEAHPDFRLVAVMNDDPSTYMVPENIQSRLSPRIPVEFPENSYELFEIIKVNVKYATDRFIELAINKMKYQEEEVTSIRDLINKTKFSLKFRKKHPDVSDYDALRKGFGY